MPPRLFITDTVLAAQARLELPAAAARHVQVLRLQPGAALVLFDGRGGEWTARVLDIGRREVTVEVEAFRPVDRELHCAVTLAVGMTANDRMDNLVEKAVELGAATIVPLLCERSVLRPIGERALHRRAHWQAVAVAATEQCGRTRVAAVAPIVGLQQWLGELGKAPTASARWLLSLCDDAVPMPEPGASSCTVLSGPEGGLRTAEEAAARAVGFLPVSLGPRVLRADTAPLALLARLSR